MSPRQHRLVVVTGAGSGIGEATAKEFARRGSAVVVSDIDERAAKDVVASIEAAGGRAFAYRLDVADASAFEAFAEDVKRRHGVADVIVNNAGVGVAGQTLDIDAADWKRFLDINLMGVVHGSRLFGQQMIERGAGGHIVNMSSMSAYVPMRNGGPYCTSKAAVRMLSECLRLELAPAGIGVSVLCPGAIDTAIFSSTNFVGGDGQTTVGAAAVAGSVMRWAVRFGFASSPHVVARAVVCSVRHNLATVPVRPEAWILYALSRLSPDLTRVVGGAVSGDGILALVDGRSSRGRSEPPRWKPTPSGVS